MKSEWKGNGMAVPPQFAQGQGQVPPAKKGAKKPAKKAKKKATGKARKGALAAMLAQRFGAAPSGPPGKGGPMMPPKGGAKR